ncbi:MAG TPA: MinD/ParA family protein, partial [Bacillota bacterium]|nr:MinD/ParA family protein [Bacillota bacterium]
VLDDQSVSKAVKNQEAFFTRYPKSAASFCLEQLANQLVDKNAKQLAPAGIRSFVNKVIKFFG